MLRTSAVIWTTVAFSVASTLAAPLAVPQWDCNGLALRSGEVVSSSGGLQRRFVIKRPGPTHPNQPQPGPIVRPPQPYLITSPQLPQSEPILRPPEPSLLTSTAPQLPQSEPNFRPHEPSTPTSMAPQLPLPDLSDAPLSHAPLRGGFLGS